MAADLPNDYDVIVLGTGLPESILAAAFARTGLKVLHIDRNDYYSANWASFNLQGIEKWRSEQQHASCYTTGLDEEKLSALLKTGEKAIGLPKSFHCINDAKSAFHVEERPKVEPPKGNTTDAAPEQGSIAEDVFSPQTSETENVGDSQPLGETEKPEGEDGKGDVEEVGAVDSGASTVPGQFDSASEDDVESEAGRQDGSSPVGKENEGSGDASETQSAQEKKQQEWFADDIQKEWRRFSLDLAPKLLYCAGSMVELLIASDVAKYCEFRTVSCVLTVRDKQLEKVPCSRADVFASKAISLPEKRLLMKFLTFAAEYDQHEEEYKDYLSQPFVNFLTSKKLSPKIQHFVLHSIAMATQITSTEQGLASIQKFLRSLGRYGNTAFLFPLYGSGELPQAFCRLSAVFGGCYVLTLSASHIIVNEENKCIAVVTSAGQRIDCKYLIADPSYLPQQFYTASAERHISRGVFITDRTIFPSKEEELSLLQLPVEEESAAPTTILELPPSSMVVPRNLFVVHMTRPAWTDACSDLQQAVSTLFEEKPSGDDAVEQESSKPKVLWSLYFQHQDLSVTTRTESTPANLFVVTGPGTELDLDRYVGEAKDIFKQICPDEEFLPKPPHPDDIIYVDDEQTPAAGTGPEDWTGNPDSNLIEDAEEVGGSLRGADGEVKEQAMEYGAKQGSAEKSEPSPVCSAGGDSDSQKSENIEADGRKDQ